MIRKFVKWMVWDQFEVVISPKGKAIWGHMFCHIPKLQRGQLLRFCNQNVSFKKIQNVISNKIEYRCLHCLCIDAYQVYNFIGDIFRS